MAAEIDVAAWIAPLVFKWLKQAGNVTATEMARTFNMGIGMVAVVSQENSADLISELEAAGEKAFIVGKLVPRILDGCILKNLESWG